jgi:hypothetical protein
MKTLQAIALLGATELHVAENPFPPPEDSRL